MSTKESDNSNLRNNSNNINNINSNTENNKINKIKILQIASISLIIISLCTSIVFTILYMYNQNIHNLKQQQNITQLRTDLINNDAQLQDMTKNYNKILQQYDKLLHEFNLLNEQVENFKQKFNNAPLFKITSYDLSINSCEKSMNHPDYGITKTGRSLKGLSREQARTVACDPSILKLGTNVYLYFTDDKYKKYNGIYICNDVGGGVKGQHLDLFLGDFNSEKESQECYNFGVTQAKVMIVER